ncbi:hypothetical protein MTP99_016370 [Tenebrio molitor]|nr:hypothetical protein MTP99_016370 [Tenebrio molitor]
MKNKNHIIIRNKRRKSGRGTGSSHDGCPPRPRSGVNGHEIPTEEEDFLCVGVATIAFQPGRISTAQWTRTTTKQRSINNSWAMSFGAHYNMNTHKVLEKNSPLRWCLKRRNGHEGIRAIHR